VRANYIAVEGPIAVGKTTLATKLAESFGAELLNDTEVTNPYLESFYRTRHSMSFHTQLHFLVSRLDLLEREGVGSEGRRHVVDFLLAKDRLFAELNLDETEWWMYRQLYDRLRVPPAVPDLVIYLQAPVEVLIQRIERRGLRFEQSIDSAYLQQVIERYERFFHTYEDSSLLIVNASVINIADEPSDYAGLIRQIEALGPGRHYFNPGQ